MKTRKPKNLLFSVSGWRAVGARAWKPSPAVWTLGDLSVRKTRFLAPFFSTVHFVQNQGAIRRLRQIICPLTKQKMTGAIHSVTYQAKGQAVQNTIICQDRLGTNTEQRENKRARVLFSDLICSDSWLSSMTLDANLPQVKQRSF